MQALILERSYLPHSTTGVLHMPDGSELHTIELPWLNNEKLISCIPEGTYNLKYRPSLVISKITHSRFLGGFEIMKVPGRTDILLHPGNYPSDVQGCIAMGNKLALMNDPKGDSPYGVANSQVTFQKFMKAMPIDGDYRLVITAKHAHFI